MTYGNYPDWGNIEKVLVIKMRHHGDVLLTSPLFSILKQRRPHVQIDAFIYEDTYPLLEGHPAISHFFLYNRKYKEQGLWTRYAQELALLWKIRKNRYDLVFNLTEGDRGAIAAWVSGAKYRIGQEGGKGSYTHLVKWGSNPRHTVEKQLDFLRCTGVFPEDEEKELFLDIPHSALSGIPESYVVIHPTSRWRFKCLSPLQMGQVILGLHKEGHHIVVSSGTDPIEIKMVEEILSHAKQVPVYNVAGKLSLKGFAALIQRAKALICVDSLPLHIASATKTPVVALFGPTSEINWGPWRHPAARVLTASISCRPCYRDGCGGSKRSDCLFALSPQHIVDAVGEILCLQK
ncbi:MAG: lipopolysaccharide core heptosyltransferase rfaQ [Chlamydiota bacterium]|jgi:heptosyltransferase-3